MVKEEEIIAEAGGRGYMDMLGLGDEPDYFMCLSPPSYLSSSAVSTTTSATPTAASPTCASYLAAPYHHILGFSGQAEQYHGDDLFGFQYYGGDHAIPVMVPQKSSPTTECSTAISSMSSSPTATAISAISSSGPQALKKKGSRSGDQSKTASAAATNKRPRVSAFSTSTSATTYGASKVRRERLGERIIALQQLVSPFGKSDTASVLHEALGYIRFLHGQVQVLSSPYTQRLPPSPRVPVRESAAGVVAEPRPSDLRSRGLCLVPVSCTEHVAGDSNGNGSDMWSVAVGIARATAAAEEEAAALLRGDCPGQLA